MLIAKHTSGVHGVSWDTVMSPKSTQTRLNGSSGLSVSPFQRLLNCLRQLGSQVLEASAIQGDEILRRQRGGIHDSYNETKKIEIMEF